jgi:trans-2-enoyl-CoA reductase
VKALQYDHTGVPREALKLRELPLPVPEPGALRLRIAYAPIHPSDLNLIEGTYGTKAILPSIPGGEASAHVDAIGDGVEGFSPGQAVTFKRRFGTWREYLCAPAADCHPLPEGINLQQASMLLINPATAWIMLQDLMPLQAGDWVLQNAANSAVGLSIIQVAKALGYRTCNLVRRAELCNSLSALGADHVILDQAGAGRAIRECLGETTPVHLAFNAVGGDSALHLMNGLSPHGTLVTYGAMGRRPLKVPNGLLIFKGLQLRGFWLTDWFNSTSPDAITKLFEALTDLSRTGGLRLPVAGCFALDDYEAALEAAGSERRDGKILFKINPELPQSSS